MMTCALRLRGCGAALLAGVLLATWSSGWAQQQSTFSREEVQQRGEAIQRVREGTELSGRVGWFELTGDRVAFHSEDGQLVLRALENLALERISTVLEESRGKVVWEVNGLVTEFRGQNFLLTTRAVRKTQAQLATQ